MSKPRCVAVSLRETQRGIDRYKEMKREKAHRALKYDNMCTALFSGLNILPKLRQSILKCELYICGQKKKIAPAD